MVDICFDPGCDLEWLLARLAWSLLPVENVRVRIWNATKISSPALPAKFDQAIPFEKLLNSVEWLAEQAPGIPIGELQITGGDGKIIRKGVSWSEDSNREGSVFSQLGYSIRSSEIPAIRRNSEQRFLEWSRSRRGIYKMATVIATGPSFDWYEKLDTGGDFVVTCNSAVINAEMMDRVHPDAVVFADPIFHFGPSLYAGSFREELRKAALRNEFIILIPEIYALLFIAAMPELQSRTFFVPLSMDSTSFNLDLTSRWEVKVTKNVLTFLMLPIASTFAETIRILGCDGRALAENSYFWGHNKSAQINERMTNIQRVHPGFFAIDYNDYYLDHCRSLETLLSQSEAEGKRIHSVAPSKIPALASRAVSPELRGMVDGDTETALGCARSFGTAGEVSSLNGRIDFISINPSLRSRMGHAIHQDLSMRSEVERVGSGFASLAHRELIPELRGGFALPVFSVMSVEVARATGNRQIELASKFVEEMFSGIETLGNLADTKGATLFLYLGHSSLLAPIASRLSTGRFSCSKIVVNLFSGYFDSVSNEGRLADLIETALKVVAVSDIEKLAVVCDSVLFADASWRASGLRIAALPMAPSQAIAPTERQPRSGPLRVVFPSHAENLRGFGILQKFAGKKARLFDGVFDFTIRQFAPWDSSLSELPHDKGNVNWVGGELSDEAYRDLLCGADILLLPYCPDAFHYRTSSILTEAFSQGKPVIVVDGSWLSHQVRQTGSGWIMKNLSVSALVAVLREIALLNPDEIRGRKYDGAEFWLRDNSIEKFVAAVIDSEQRDHEVDPARLLLSLHVMRKRNSGLSLIVARTVRINEMMKEEIRTLLPEPVKNLLRPWVGRFRRLRASGISSLLGKPKEKTTIAAEELAHGMARGRKARLDEGELIRSYFSNQSGRPESTRLCIDVGAHYGTSARPLLEDGWKVIAFEPDVKNREKLLSGLKKYIPEKLVIEDLAVSDEEAEDVSFYRSEVSTGISGLSSFHESHASAGSVSTTTLASYSRKNAIERVDFLKIDTEGFDFHVLRGIPWEDWKPEAVLCEFEDRKTLPLGYGWTEMADFLKEKGYDIWVSEWHPIIEYGRAHDWNRLFRYPGDLSNTESWGNLLAFQNQVDSGTMESLLKNHLQVYGK